MLVAIINHAQTAAALALKQAFSAQATTVALDSGSTLSDAERAGFDRALPNVYYSGLINAVAELAAPLGDDEPVYVWASDVSVGDPGRAVALAQEAFENPQIGTYAPSAWFSGHAQMWNHRTGRLRRGTFAEGFCFATRAAVLRALCPIDTRINAFGWGLDLQIAFLTRQRRQYVVIDDRIEVSHPKSTGYSTSEAQRQRQAWVAGLSPRARRYHRVASWGWTRQPPLTALVHSLPW
jgi:hypothetical protein